MGCSWSLSAEFASIIDDIRHNRMTRPPQDRSAPNYWNGIGRVVSICRLPNGKTDANHQASAFLSTDLAEENWPWPTSSWAWRDRYAERLTNYILGLLWFIQHDSEVPAAIRRSAQGWGLAKDEYVDNDHFPRQPYIREGRRIMGEYLFAAHDAASCSTYCMSESSNCRRVDNTTSTEPMLNEREASGPQPDHRIRCVPKWVLFRDVREYVQLNDRA